MNREVHVRFWERPEVKVLRATRHSRRFRDVRAVAALPSTTAVTCSAANGAMCQDQTQNGEVCIIAV